jgi:predicted DNA-binding protein (MmcQ/YjbR family)
MNVEQVAAYCLALPGAREDYKWGGVRVFSIADTKMFAVMGLAGDDLSFPSSSSGMSTVPACDRRPILHALTGSP